MSLREETDEREKKKEEKDRTGKDRERMKKQMVRGPWRGGHTCWMEKSSRCIRDGKACPYGMKIVQARKTYRNIVARRIVNIDR